MVVRGFFAAGTALVRFMAGDADLARDVDEERDDDVLGTFLADFFADVLVDVVAVFDAAAFACFDFA